MRYLLFLGVIAGCSGKETTPTTQTTTPATGCDDADGDGICDADDICDGSDDAIDGDGDGVPDGCDACPLDADDDSDGDGVCDSQDSCAGFDDNADSDGDGAADACDVCPLDNPDDSDADTVCDSDDVCDGYDDTLDGDLDGNPDDCDACPYDNPDDSDGDTVCDSLDLCPGDDDTLDADLDLVPDACDPCPSDNPDDSDLDGVCDSVDVCPGYDDALDADLDGQADGCDPCPLDNPDDPDGDGLCGNQAGIGGLLPATPGGSSGWGNLAFDGNGDLLVAASDTGNIYRMDRTTGAFTTLSVIGGYVLSVVYDPTTDRIYAGDSNSDLWDIDPVTGSAVPLVNISPGIGITGMEIAPNGFGAYGGWVIATGAGQTAGTGALYAIDPANPAGFATLLANGPWLSDLAFDDAGTLYVADNEVGMVQTADSTGTLTPLITTTLSGAGGLDWDGIGGRLWIADDDGDQLYEYTVPGGVLTARGAFEFDSGWYPSGLLFDGVDTLVMCTGESGLPFMLEAYTVP